MMVVVLSMICDYVEFVHRYLQIPHVLKLRGSRG